MANSTACRLSTGSAPGSPRQTGQTFVLGGAPKLVGQPQKIFVRVASWTCTSKPITGSYRAIASGGAKITLDDMAPLYGWSCRPKSLLKKRHLEPLARARGSVSGVLSTSVSEPRPLGSGQ